MNVGHPSNLSRIFALYGGIIDEKGTILRQPSAALKDEIFSMNVSDEETRNTIAGAMRDYNIVLEPHGAVSWKAMDEYARTHGSEDDIYISLETAHPAKFTEELTGILNCRTPLPESLKGLDTGEEVFEQLSPEYPKLKELLIQKY